LHPERKSWLDRCCPARALTGKHKAGPVRRWPSFSSQLTGYARPHNLLRGQLCPDHLGQDEWHSRLSLLLRVLQGAAKPASSCAADQYGIQGPQGPRGSWHLSNTTAFPNKHPNVLVGFKADKIQRNDDLAPRKGWSMGHKPVAWRPVSVRMLDYAHDRANSPWSSRGCPGRVAAAAAARCCLEPRGLPRHASRLGRG
jgi:hypothetical protein